MARDAIVVLDFSGKEEAYEFLGKSDQAIYTKVGMKLFYKGGPDIVREIKKKGHKVFLDLKFHDIPNTAWGAVRSVLDLDVDTVNFHVPAGKKAIRGARGASDQTKSSTILLEVTVLTSMEEEDLRDLSTQGSLKDTAKSHGKLGLDAGFHGLVCSAQEVADLKKDLGDFVAVIPGIRPGSQVGQDDQKRTMTPAQAAKADSDYIVVGHPIRNIQDSLEAYRTIKEEFLEEEVWNT